MALDKLVDSTQLDADLTSVADAIRAKSGGSSALAFPAGFVSEIGNIPSGGGGQTVYASSTGLLYTPIMTIDLSMERTNGYPVSDILTRYGAMPYLEELTLSGIVRLNSANLVLAQTGQFNSTSYPMLKKLHIEPTEIRAGNGSEIDTSASNYNQIKAGHYAFTGTNLTELTIGRVGGPYWQGGGYFRNDMPQPPGTNGLQTGSLDGLTLKVYMAAYNATAGFSSSLAPNTTLIVYDYQTGEVLTA